MDKIDLNLAVDELTTFGFSISSNILTAFYSSLLLKKLSGMEITGKIEEQSLNEVFQKWLEVHTRVSEAAKKHLSLQQGAP